MTTSERIKQARRRGRITQEVLAELVGVSRATVARWERGSSIPDVEQMEAILEHCRALRRNGR